MSRGLYKTLSNAGRASFPAPGSLQRFLLSDKTKQLLEAEAKRRSERLNKWGQLALAGGLGSAALGMYANRTPRKPGELPAPTRLELMFPVLQRDGIPPHA